MKKVLLLAIFSVFAYSSFAQFTLTAEVRPRFEYRNGFKTLRPENNFKAASFVEQRTRVYFDYQKEKLRLHLAVQDIRMWGNNNQIYKTDPSLTNFYEAYGSYQINEKFLVKVGRQKLSYDTERFMGGLDWAQQGRSHDAILIRFKTDNAVQVDGAIALNNSGVEPFFLNAYPNPYTLNNYKNMQMIHASKTWEKAYVSLIFQNDGRQVFVNDSSVQYRQTYGIVANSILTDAISIAGEFYYQGGINSRGQTVNALFADLEVTLNTDITPITIGGEYASGTSLENANQNNAWTPLYGTNHKWYGYMDYFYVGNAHGQFSDFSDPANPSAFRTTGLIDLFLKTDFKLAERQMFAVHGHYFASPVTLYSTKSTDTPNTVELNSGLGVEIDLVYTFVIQKDVIIQVGYSHMLPTESMEAIKNNGIMDGRASGVTNNWAFVMLRFKPELFTTQK